MPADARTLLHRPPLTLAVTFPASTELGEAETSLVRLVAAALTAAGLPPGYDYLEIAGQQPAAATDRAALVLLGLAAAEPYAAAAFGSRGRYLPAGDSLELPSTYYARLHVRAAASAPALALVTLY